jgi:peptidoglycan/LPS O-acetylase OafA/YrhL
LGTHLFLVHNFWEKTFYGISGPFWSIAVEFQLYLIYPLLLLLVRRTSWTGALWILAAIEIPLRLVSGFLDIAHQASLPFLITGSPVFYWFSWSIGAAAADAFLKGRELPFWKVPVWLFPLLTVLSGFTRPLAPLSFTFASLATVSVIGMLLKHPEKTSNPGFVSRHLAFVGVVSYSLYLLHQPILDLAHKVLGKLDIQLSLLPSILVTMTVWIPAILASRAYYRFMELPSIEAGKRLVKSGILGKRAVYPAAGLAGTSAGAAETPVAGDFGES